MGVIKAVMVAIRAMDKVATVATRVTAINKAVTATASSKVIQGAVTELTTDLTSHAPTMIRVMGSKEATVATRAMDSKTTMVATRAMNSLGMASIRAPNTNNSLATPSNHRSNKITITAENTRRTPATSLPSRTVKRDLGTPWIWRRTPTGARATPTATRTNTERYSTLCR